MAAEKVNKVKEPSVMDSPATVKTKSTFREYAEAIIMALILALFIRTFIVQAFKIPSGSMIPTLQIGDHILVNKLSYGVRIPFLEKYLVDYAKPERGDVVVFIFPEDDSKDFIKRVIAVAGDTVEVRAKKIFINGKPAAPAAATTSVPRPSPRIIFLSWAIIGTAATTVDFGATSISTRCAVRRF